MAQSERLKLYKQKWLRDRFTWTEGEMAGDWLESMSTWAGNAIGFQTSLMDLKKAPESMVIIGAGPEGLEFAQMSAHFGTNVTVVVADGHRVLRREEPEIVADQHENFFGSTLRV